MSTVDNAQRKPLEWIGSSNRDLLAFPSKVSQTVGKALRQAQMGGKHRLATPLKGFHGAGVLEISVNWAGDTYRTVYTVRLVGMVYVLHAFKKKSTRGIATPRHEMDRVVARLQEAERKHGSRDPWRVRERPLVRYGLEGPMDAEHSPIESMPSSGNVFADLGLPNADVLLEQADLMIAITHTVERQRLSSAEAARIMGITEQELDDIDYGDFDNFSVERLTGLLAALAEATEAKTPRRGGGRGAARSARH